MASTARPLGSLSMARGCARIDAGPDTAKIGSADRVQDHARLLAVIGVRKTFPHGLDPQRTSDSARSLKSVRITELCDELMLDRGQTKHATPA